MRRLLDNIGHACAITDRNGLFIYVNALFLGIYDYAEDDIIGLSSTILSQTPNGAITPIPARDASEINRPWAGEINHVNRAGKTVSRYLFCLPADCTKTLPPCCVLHISCTVEKSHLLMADLASQLFTALIALQIDLPREQPISGPTKNVNRQGQIKILTRLGYKPKEIAAQMQISVSTVNVVKWKLRKQSAAGRAKHPGDEHTGAT